MKKPGHALWVALFSTATLAGAMIVPSDAKPQMTHSRAHYQWCLMSYPSYNTVDNTYARADGKRVQCVSPYLRGELPANKTRPAKK